jgi:hypothetical protein
MEDNVQDKACCFVEELWKTKDKYCFTSLTYTQFSFL